MKFVDRSGQRRVPGNAYDTSRLGGFIDRALGTSRARIAWFERLVRNLDLLGPRVGIGPVAPMALGSFLLGFIIVRGVFIVLAGFVLL